MEFYISLLAFIRETPIEIIQKYSFVKNIFVYKGGDYLIDIIDCLKDDIEKNIFVVSNNDEITEKIRFLAGHYIKYKVVNAFTPHNINYLRIDKFKEIVSNPLIKKYIDSKGFYRRHKCLHKIEKKNLHQEICCQIFKEIDKTKDSHEYFWVHIDHNDTFSGERNNREIDYSRGNWIRLTVLSNNALEYDRFIFEMLNVRNDTVGQIDRHTFRPYFIEYYIDIRKLDDEQKVFLSRDNIDERWFKARLAYDNESKLDNETIFKGVYAYSASPVEYVRHKLIIDHNADVDAEVLNLINKTYKLPSNHCTPYYQVAEKIKEIYNNVTFNKVRIYKVGNGNCIYSYGKADKKEKRLLYDIGFDNNTAVQEFMDRNVVPYATVLKRIRNFIPHCIILSHWDADHYKACAYGNNAIFECTWIAPDAEDAGVNAKRLGMYLYKTGKMMFIDRTASCKMINVQLNKQSQLTLYIGKNGGDLSKKNCEGIAIKHENVIGSNKKIRCLMQGDVSYRSLPPEAYFANENPYEYLVVPHHGSIMDYGLLSVNTNTAGKAVICCNNQICNNRPACGHLNKLIQCYGEVVTTEEAQSYIQFNLRNKDSMIKV